MGDSEAAKADAEPGEHRGRLQRVRVAFAARDWTGIAIELIVVTLGVLLAFQIDQFGARRAQAQDERQFIARLYSEYQRGVAELRGIISQHDKPMREIRLAMGAVGQPALLERYSRQESFGCDMVRHPGAPFNDSAYEELLSSGRLNLISNLNLRADIRDLTSAQGAAKSQLLLGRDLVVLQMSSLDPYFHYVMKPSGVAECRVDWPGLVEDPRAINAVVRAYRLHQRVSTERRKVLVQTERLLDKLSCELKKPECRTASR